MAPELHDNVSRVKRVNVLGITTFIGLRGADVFLQHALLRGWGKSLIRSLGGGALGLGATADASITQLSPYHTIVLGMALGSSLKQILTMLIVSEQETQPSSAFTIALFNTIFNSLSTVFSLWTYASQASDSATSSPYSPIVVLGITLYSVGILTEFVSELQRTRFKKQSSSKGKPYAGGLFSLARHINYGGYTIWRAAYALTSGGWLWGLAVFSFFFYDFASRGVPVLDKYLVDRYGEQWKAIKQRVPYRLIPGVY